MLSIDSKNFAPIRDYVFIRADKDKAKNKTLAGGINIVIDTRFNPHHAGNVTQDGIVEYVPAKLSNKQKIEIKKGDKVFCHHFLCDEENQVEANGEILYHIIYESIFCKIVEEKIEMLGEHCLVEPTNEEKKSSLIITPDSAIKESKNIGILRHMNKKLAEQGAKKGDTVAFTANSDYDIEVEGKKYYCMKDKDIIAVLEK